MLTATLRTKFLLSLVLITGLLTSGVLLVVRYRVQLRVREQLTEALDTSVVTFERLQQQRELTLERSAALLAALPPLKAVMTSGDRATIQDASTTFWQLAGSQVFVLADRNGRLSAFHTSAATFPSDAAQAAIARYIAGGETRDWWFGGGHLFQVFLKPIYFGDPANSHWLGLLAVGYEVDASVTADVSRAAAGEVGFAYDGQLVVSTVAAPLRPALGTLVARAPGGNGAPEEVSLGGDRFLAASVRLASARSTPVTLTVLKSFAESTAFLQNLNQWIVGVGVAGVLAGSLLVFLVSTTFTRPLGRLVSGVQALEQGDFDYPLDLRGGDEVAALTAAFARMRARIQDTQRRLVETERMATVGRMANTISHDLRHPLTAIQAYAEFLAERDLTDVQRKDFFQEIRIAINRMTDEINSLLGFSHQREALQRVRGRLDEVIERAVKTVKALPEFEAIAIAVTADSPCEISFDPGKIERVLLNLLFNAAEAVSPKHGRIDVSVRTTSAGAEIRVSDNGPGIPPAILDDLFKPFVSYGKAKGTGLGLAVVQNVMQQHGGAALVERTGPEGTTFLLRFAAESQG